jgi:hypothetical protein
MATATELVEQLDSQLVEATRRATTRAEHLRLTQIQATVALLRAATVPSELAESA